jgi:hypothetical protein
MSVKFEIADWKFELTWKEMICRPIERKPADEARERREDRAMESADAELLSDCYGREQGLIL